MKLHKQDSEAMLKMSIGLVAFIYDGIVQEAEKLGRSPTDHIEHIICQHAYKNNLISPILTRHWGLREKIIQQACDTARRRILTKGFSPDIIYETFKEIASDSKWLDDYRTFIGGDPYQTGNAKKRPINQKLGASICEAIGGKVARSGNNKPIQKSVLGSIIRRYTVLGSCTLQAEQPGTKTQQPNQEGN
ncbi:hypothetical protein [Tunturiibacter lichenicola]|uniref:hypothetical protein n=1 Tax=Tunturiibacter lichenicola TaxID=2051959 RepID=UPI003D9B3D27